MSRAHPGASVKFQKKKETNRKREFDRKVLKEAQERYRKDFGVLDIPKKKMNRQVINRLRAVIRKEWANKRV